MRGAFWANTGCRGKTPAVASTGARFGLNLISAVNRNGGFRFMYADGRVKHKGFIESLKRLLHNADTPFFLVVDGHPAPKAKKVKRFVESVFPRLELFFLPPYSPDLNADELVWNDLKNNAIGHQAIHGRDQLKQSIISFLGFLQKTPARIAS